MILNHGKTELKSNFPFSSSRYIYSLFLSNLYIEFYNQGGWRGQWSCSGYIQTLYNVIKGNLSSNQHTRHTKPSTYTKSLYYISPPLPFSYWIIWGLITSIDHWFISTPYLNSSYIRARNLRKSIVMKPRIWNPVTWKGSGI